jgi:phosphatidylglycerophosphate synthase
MILCVAWQASDVFWHLGLNRRSRAGQMYQSIGWANIFTLLRGVGTAFLLGRYTGGLKTPTTLLLVIFLLGVITDILDGQIARRTQTESKLGGMLDAETDFCQYLVIALLLLQNTLLPPWMMIVFLLRFCLPLLAALGSYFLLAQPVRIGSTQWGKWTGTAQGCYLLVLMLPRNLLEIRSLLQTPLLIATLILLIGAPIAQLLANRRTNA